MINDTNYKIRGWSGSRNMRHLTKYEINNYVKGEYNDKKTRNEYEINKKKMERLTLAEIFLNEIEEKIIKARPVKAREQVETFLNNWTSNIKDIAPHHLKATEEQIILILCFIAVNLETEYIPQMTYTSLWKKNKLNYNMYNDVLRVYFNFISYNKVVRVTNTGY